MGHSHFGLADEYSYKIDCHESGHDRFRDAESAAPNVTSIHSPLKWRNLVADGTPIPTMSNPDCSDCDTRPSSAAIGTVGAFEGAGYHRCGLYRPEYSCRMRALGYPFCAVCQEQIKKVLAPYKPQPGRRRAV